MSWFVGVCENGTTSVLSDFAVAAVFRACAMCAVRPDFISALYRVSIVPARTCFFFVASWTSDIQCSGMNTAAIAGVLSPPITAAIGYSLLRLPSPRGVTSDDCFALFVGHRQLRCLRQSLKLRP